MLLQFKKDYLRLVEVYVLEVLPRQDDWDIASDFVMGDFVMGAKRKEVSMIIGKRWNVPLIACFDRYSKCSNAYTKPRLSTLHQQHERDDPPPTYLEAAARRL